MSDSETLQTFPCEYTFKVFGRQSDTFVERVRSIVAATFGPVADQAVSERASSGGKYLSVTIVQWVERREQLEEAYAALKAEPEVLLYI
jgi:putative lipoic acid-binding regulatory protein